MLASLCVAPLLPSPTLRAAANGLQVGTGKQAQSIELESGVRRGAAWPPVTHFYSGPPMHLLSGVDTVIEQITFLMYARLLDINETRDENRQKRTGKSFQRRFKEDEQSLRWSHFRHTP